MPSGTPPGLAKGQSLALQEQLSWFTVAILCGDRRHHGSGVPIKWKERVFLATAKHLVKDEDDQKLGYLTRNGAALIDVVRKREVRSTFLAKREQVAARIEKPLPVVRRMLAQASDLVLLELDKSVALNEQLRFYEPKSLDIRTPGPGEEVAVIGFSDDISLRFKHLGTGIPVKMLGLWLDTPKIVESRDDLSSDFNRHTDFLMGYPYDEAEVADPHGMSGCGVWRLRRVKGDIWALASPELVGVQTGWYTRSGLLTAVRIEVLNKLLSEL